MVIYTKLRGISVFKLVTGISFYNFEASSVAEGYRFSILSICTFSRRRRVFRTGRHPCQMVHLQNSEVNRNLPAEFLESCLPPSHTTPEWCCLGLVGGIFSIYKYFVTFFLSFAKKISSTLQRL